MIYDNYTRISCFEIELKKEYRTRSAAHAITAQMFTFITNTCTTTLLCGNAALPGFLVSSPEPCHTTDVV